jgi:hypothetical protein
MKAVIKDTGTLCVPSSAEITLLGLTVRACGRSVQDLAAGQKILPLKECHCILKHESKHHSDSDGMLSRESVCSPQLTMVYVQAL